MEKAINAFFRIAYLLGYRFARLIWRFTSPLNNGVLVAIWHRGKVLLIRNSYRNEWSFPGGGIDQKEEPISAAVREIREELGVIFAEDDLSLLGEIKMNFHHRIDTVKIFQVNVKELPIIKIDNREITKAIFFDPKDVLVLNITPHVRVFLESRLDGGTDYQKYRK